MFGMKVSSIAQAADWIVKNRGNELRIATPLGLGKPNLLLNELYRRAQVDPSLKMSIFTALSLNPPQVREDLARRFFIPFAERQWGADYPELAYYKDGVKGSLPSNVEVTEFYFQAGTALQSKSLQSKYQSVNYTHVSEVIHQNGINTIVQMVARREGSDGVEYSLSCNPDLTLDVAEIYKQKATDLKIIAVVHPELPFMAGEARVEASFFDLIVESSEMTHQIFALPRMPIQTEDHLIGFYASTLMPDDGTIQIGIGSLSDAVVNSLVCRHTKNHLYTQAVRHILEEDSAAGTFEKGLYGLTEMLTDGYMHLRRAGILKREVTDEISGQKTFLHGSFFLGSKSFYQWLREMNAQEASGLRMTRVSKVNDLFDENEMLLRRQRRNARFFNTTMQVTVLGEAMSETLPDGQVVSGVGGQYNFVAMSRELQGGRSILMLRSTRIDSKGRRVSNIVWEPGHVTIPRHLRDIVVTEYGIADLRGKNDEECILEMIAVADAEFQDDLLSAAQACGKVSKSRRPREKKMRNTPQNLRIRMGAPECAFLNQPFPFGSDFTADEENIVLALAQLQEEQKKSKLKVIAKALISGGGAADWAGPLRRLKLEAPANVSERLLQRVMVAYFKSRASGLQNSLK